MGFEGPDNYRKEVEKRTGLARPNAKDYLIDFMSAAALPVLGLPVNILRSEALKMMAKDFRAFRKTPGRYKKLLPGMSQKDFATHEKKVYKEITKALKSVPDKELAKVENIGLWRGVEDIDDFGKTYKLSSTPVDKERVRFRTSQPVEEAQKTVWHEFAHVAQPSRIPSEWKAEEFAEALSKRAANKELGRIVPDEYYDILKSMKMHTKPGY